MRNHEEVPAVGEPTGALESTQIAQTESHDQDANSSGNPPADRSGKAFDFTPIGDLKPALKNRWLVKGLMPKKGLMVVYGQPGSGKTFVVLDALLAVATGQPYAGRKTRTGAVIYVIAEGQDEFINRCVAALHYRGKNTAKDEVPFAIVTVAPDLGKDENDAKSLARHVNDKCKEQNWVPVAICIDTLTRAMPGRDQNGSEALSTFVKNCGVLSSKIGCLVIAVHHSGKDATKGMMGSQVLHGATDAEWQVSLPDNGPGKVHVQKMRDGDHALCWHFSLSSFELGRDEDGDSVATCIVNGVSNVGKSSCNIDATKSLKENKGVSKIELCFREAMQNRTETYELDGVKIKGVSICAVREIFKAKFFPENADAERQAWSRGMRSLQEIGLLKAISGNRVQIMYRKPEG